MINDLKDRKNELRSLATKRVSINWIKYHNIIYSLNCLQIAITIIEKGHQKLYDNPIVKK